MTCSGVVLSLDAVSSMVSVPSSVKPSGIFSVEPESVVGAALLTGTVSWADEDGAGICRVVLSVDACG